MKESLFPRFMELYATYKTTKEYQERLAQTVIAPVIKEIIAETLKNQPLENDHLTALIQMFKFNTSDRNFNQYLASAISDENRRKELSDEFYKTHQKGYTNAGRSVIRGLNRPQLDTIHKFISDAFNVGTKPEAIKLCNDFDDKNIPFVKKGIYSPWLYYINPELFPVINNTHNDFLKWINIPPFYPDCIEAFSRLKEMVHEKDLGMLDWFGYTFKIPDGPSSPIKTLDLAGNRIFKISHGAFKKEIRFKYSGILDILEKNNLISMDIYTGKGQGDRFKNQLKIGDFVYICYGGDSLQCIGKINSDALSFEGDLKEKIDEGAIAGEVWMYRKIEPLFFPKIDSLLDLKTERNFYMPSGNSTLFEIPEEALDPTNKILFIPKYNVRIIDSKVVDPPAQPIIQETPKDDWEPKNIILYGPPGTGKTFHSVNYAVAIIEGKSPEEVQEENRELVKSKFEDYQKSGQIVFSTFHQSLGYEDFIEGIKPKIEDEEEDKEIAYQYKDGIFKKLCIEAAFSYVKQDEVLESKKVLDFSEQYDRYIDILLEDIQKKGTVEIPTKTGGKIIVSGITKNNNIEIKHPNGNRPYIVSKSRLSKISQAYPDINNLSNFNERFRVIIGGMNSTGFWAILNAIRNQKLNPSDEVATTRPKEYSYSDKKASVGLLSKQDYKRSNFKKYVLIIDEINRGNVSQIFGELITLIENDKRAGQDEELRAVLPYSEDIFCVPANLYIIGTMNTADRSVEALDTALRRRFSFIQIIPMPDKLVSKIDGIDLSKLLRSLNERLAILKDHDHTIGHAWFWNVSNLEQLKSKFGNMVLPLLQEFFYNDFEKLGLVLGDAFFEPPQKVNHKIFAKFKGGNDLSDQYDDTWQYQLKSADKLTTADFQSLYQTTIPPATDEQ